MSQTPVAAPYIFGMVNEAGLPVTNPNPADAFVKGFGQPGDIVNVFQNGQLEGSTTVDANGGGNSVCPRCRMVRTLTCRLLKRLRTAARAICRTIWLSHQDMFRLTR